MSKPKQDFINEMQFFTRAYRLGNIHRIELKLYRRKLVRRYTNCLWGMDNNTTINMERMLKY